MSDTGSVRKHRDGTLKKLVTDTLRDEITAGTPAVGEKLASESELIARFEVSRTVIREALSALRMEGLVEPRQGAGVFVTAQRSLQLSGADPKRLSSVIEDLELRTAIEVEAAYLAGSRCSPMQEEVILRLHHELGARIVARLPTAEVDFAFHLAIAEASNNRRIHEVLQQLGREMIPRVAMREAEDPSLRMYLDTLQKEHGRIVEAISDRDPRGAKDAMRVHLQNSQKRYRSYLNASLAEVRPDTIASSS